MIKFNLNRYKNGDWKNISMENYFVFEFKYKGLVYEKIY